MEEAPSNLALIGRYVLSPAVFDVLERTEPGRGNEIQLTDSMAKLMQDQAFHAYVYEGDTHDCGDKIGLLKIDYLGLTNLTILARAIELIERQRGVLGCRIGS